MMENARSCTAIPHYSETVVVCGQLLVLTILLRGETSTQVIRFVLIHTFNIAHN